jgi:hypothetical protein
MTGRSDRCAHCPISTRLVMPGWRRRPLEVRLNGLGQVRTVIDGLGIHGLSVRSPHEGAVPLVLTNVRGSPR